MAGNGKPLSDRPVEDLIEHYTRVLEDVKKTAETVGIVLTERGKQILEIQQRNIENALKQLGQQQGQRLKEIPAPETIRPSVPEPSRPHIRQTPEPQPGLSEPEFLRQRDPSDLPGGGRSLAQQRRTALERQEPQKPEDRPQRHTSSHRHHEERTLAQQRP